MPGRWRIDGQARTHPLTSLPNRRAWDEALARADAALNEAKDTGRDCLRAA